MRVGVSEVEEEDAKPARTHWDMLMERRSMEELQVILEERLAIRRGEKAPEV